MADDRHIKVDHLPKGLEPGEVLEIKAVVCVHEWSWNGIVMDFGYGLRTIVCAKCGAKQDQERDELGRWQAKEGSDG